jgi:hypothetical protein
MPTESKVAEAIQVSGRPFRLVRLRETNCVIGYSVPSTGTAPGGEQGPDGANTPAG